MLRAERSSYHYRGRRADQAELKKRTKEIAETRVRYGYRRIHVLLRREGWDVNAKRIYRLYKEIGLQLRKKPPKRRVKAKLREGRCAASCSNEVWAMDFVHDQLATTEAAHPDCSRHVQPVLAGGGAAVQLPGSRRRGSARTRVRRGRLSGVDPG